MKAVLEKFVQQGAKQASPLGADKARLLRNHRQRFSGDNFEASRHYAQNYKAHDVGFPLWNGFE